MPCMSYNMGVLVLMGIQVMKLTDFVYDWLIDFFYGRCWQPRLDAQMPPTNYCDFLCLFWNEKWKV